MAGAQKHLSSAEPARRLLVTCRELSSGHCSSAADPAATAASNRRKPVSAVTTLRRGTSR